MNTLHCTYAGDREDALITYLYREPDSASSELAAFELHLATCARCADELRGLRGVQTQLEKWAPPERVDVSSPSDGRQSSWWRQVPVWAQVAAALLFLGVSAGIANLDIKYDASGLSVRTGWMSPAPVGPQASAPVAPGSGAPWRADLTALQRQLETEFRAVQMSTSASAPHAQTTRAGAPAPADAEVLRRVRALIEESEKRQQNELALRVAEVVRDVHAMRQADLVKIDRTLGEVRNDLGVEVMRDRQRLNTLLVRTSGGSRD